MDNNRQSMALVNCDKGGAHEGERITMVCTNPLCREDCLLCSTCFSSRHSGHEVLQLETVLEDFEERLRTIERKQQLNLTSDIDASKALCMNAVSSLSNYIEAKLSKLTDKMALNFTEATKKSAQQWATSTQRVRNFRMENSKKQLQVKLLEMLDSAHISNGRISSISHDFLPFKGKPTDTINTYTQSFLLTLKNIHAVVQQQYAKMCDPYTQPHNIKREFTLPLEAVTAASSGQTTSKVVFSRQNSKHTYSTQTLQSSASHHHNHHHTAQLSRSPSTVLSPTQMSYDGGYFLRKIKPSSEKQLQSLQQEEVSPAAQKQHINSDSAMISTKKQVTIDQSAAAAADNRCHIKSPSFSNLTKDLDIIGLSMQVSTVAQSIPNFSQLQTANAELYKRVQQQQLMLSTLQHGQDKSPSTLLQQQDNIPMFGSSTTTTLTNQNISPPSFRSREVDCKRNEGSASQRYLPYEDENNIQQLSISLATSPKGFSTTNIPAAVSTTTSIVQPQQSRLLYYSSLFSQHVSNRSTLHQSPLNLDTSALSKIESTSVRHKKSTIDSKRVQGAATTITNPYDASELPRRMRSLENGGGKSIQHQSYDAATETRERMEQDLLDSDLVMPKYKDLPKSSERTFKFRFHKDFRHEFLAVTDAQRSVKGTSDKNESRLALISPSVETKPLSEYSWTLKIVSIKSMAYSTPLAVGLCFKRFVESSQYKFNGEDTILSSSLSLRSPSSTSKSTMTTTSSSVQSQKSLLATTSEHGCYLLTSTGFIRNHSDKSQDMKRAQVRFNQGDILHFHFNPFRNYLKIKNATSGQLCMINTQFHPGDQLYPCVRISYCQDQVQIIESDYKE